MRGPRCALPRLLYDATFAAFREVRCVRSADPDIAIVLPLLEQIKRGDSAYAPSALSPCRVRVRACCASGWGGVGERGCVGVRVRFTFALRVRVRVRVRVCACVCVCVRACVCV